ncbi:hypothetical protein D9M71_246970 [compost metagenome]
MQTIDRQADCQPQVVFQAAKVRGDELFQRRVLEDVISAFESVLPFLWQVQAENRFVDLHPLHALARQAA